MSRAPGSTPARRRMSSVPSSMRTSMTSSTVTNPTTLPSFSSTGTARRLYFAILFATDSWSSSASAVMGLRRITSVRGRSRSAITRSRNESEPSSRPVSGSRT